MRRRHLRRSFANRLVVCAVAVAAGTVAPRPADANPAAQPDQTPFLMLDSRMHTGQIYRLSVDAAGKRLATGSTDKSIRIWDVESGRLLRRLHVPVGRGQIGSVLSVALTPNGKYLLAASESFQSDGRFDKGSVYFFHVESGKIIGRIPELPANVTHIAVSPGAKYFGLVLGKWGFSLRNARGKELFKETARGRDTDDPIEWLAFANDNRFAAVSRKGALRIYAERNGKIRRTNARRMPRGLTPYSLAYSPDGKRLAVGYGNRVRVDVIEAESLKTVQSLVPNGLSGGNIGAVAWATERSGAWLYAAGTAKDKSNRTAIVGWRQGRAGTSVILGAARDSIPHIQGAKGGGVVFASSEPAWGHATLDRTGRQLVLRREQRTRAIAFRGTARRQLAISDDGVSVAVPGSRSLLAFDLRGLELHRNGRSKLLTRRARETGSRIALRDWYGRTTFQIGTRQLSLQPGERALSAQVDEARNIVLIGTDYFLRLYDAQGRELAKRRLNAPAWGLVTASTKDVAVVAHGDGSIRWYALRPDAPLAELASVFIHRDGRRWVAWRADGRFAHSPFGGKEMVGYYKNGTLETGNIQALTGEWVAFEQLYRLFYDPRAVSALLDEPSTWPGIAAQSRVDTVLNAQPLPTVTIESYCALTQLPPVRETRGASFPKTGKPTGRTPPPAPGTGANCFPVGAVEQGFAQTPGARRGRGAALPAGTRALRIKIRVAHENGAFGPVDAFVNGRNVGRLSPEGGTREQHKGQSGQPVPSLVFSHDVPVYAGANKVAIKAYNTSGAYRSSDPAYFQVPATVASDGKPVLRVLSVGINRYRGVRKLVYAVADAQSFAAKVRTYKPETYGRTDVVTLTDEQATTARILQELDALADRVKSNDAVLIYFAGHGISDEEGSYYFIPMDVTKFEDRFTKGMKHQVLVDKLAAIRVRNLFLFLDTCYSGEFKLNPRGPDTLAHETGQFVLTASTSEQEALDSYNDKNGVFAYAVHQALSSKPADADIVDALDVGLRVRRLVPKLAREKRFTQAAVFKAAGGDISEFPIAQP